MHVSVLIVDDHMIMRDGLKALLNRAEDVEIVGEASDGKEALKKVQELHPDVVVMDLTMPRMSGIEATRKIIETNQNINILALSMLQDKECVMECLKAGAKGYLIKNCAAEELLTAIRTLAKGESYLCTQVTKLLIQGVVQKSDEEQKDSTRHKMLTPRELQVLKLISDGLSTKEIAFELDLSIKTIDVQRHKIMKKLNLRSIAALVKYAIREGLTTSE